jgi:gluconate 2-dehydrogenase gamma chain
MTVVNRRALLKLLASAPAAAALTWTDAEAAQAHHAAEQARQTAQRAATPFKPQFFTAHEWATVSLLVDYIIPRDEKSGSATDAGVPEFMDFMMTVDQPARQIAMRGGLAWIDRECVTRFDQRFVTATDAQRRAVLDDISWPRRARPALQAGVTFFASFRDLTASGFFTSKIGMQDVGFRGNTVVREWKGCPDEVLKKLGLA